MKVYLFYRPYSESAMTINNFLRHLADYQRDKIDLVDIDTRDGDDLSKLYGVVDYPSAMVTLDDGQQINFWHGQLPGLEEFTVYLS